MSDCPLANSLLSGLSLSSGQGGGPLHLEVTVTTSDEVLSLRSQIVDYQERLDQLEQQYRKVEFWYSCEVRINAELVDLLRQNGIVLPARFLNRPYKTPQGD